MLTLEIAADDCLCNLLCGRCARECEYRGNKRDATALSSSLLDTSGVDTFEMMPSTSECTLEARDTGRDGVSDRGAACSDCGLLEKPISRSTSLVHTRVSLFACNAR